MTDLIATPRAAYGPATVEEQLAFDRLSVGVSFHYERNGHKVRVDPSHVIVEHGGERTYIDPAFAHLYPQTFEPGPTSRPIDPADPYSRHVAIKPKYTVRG